MFEWVAHIPEIGRRGSPLTASPYLKTIKTPTSWDLAADGSAENIDDVRNLCVRLKMRYSPPKTPLVLDSRNVFFWRNAWETCKPTACAVYLPFVVVDHCNPWLSAVDACNHLDPNMTTKLLRRNCSDIRLTSCLPCISVVPLCSSLTCMVWTAPSRAPKSRAVDNGWHIWYPNTDTKCQVKQSSPRKSDWKSWACCA